MEREHEEPGWVHEGREREVASIQDRDATEGQTRVSSCFFKNNTLTRKEGDAVWVSSVYDMSPTVRSRPSC